MDVDPSMAVIDLCDTLDTSRTNSTNSQQRVSPNRSTDDSSLRRKSKRSSVPSKFMRDSPVFRRPVDENEKKKRTEDWVKDVHGKATGRIMRRQTIGGTSTRSSKMSKDNVSKDFVCCKTRIMILLTFFLGFSWYGYSLSTVGPKKFVITKIFQPINLSRYNSSGENCLSKTNFKFLWHSLSDELMPAIFTD